MAARSEAVADFLGDRLRLSGTDPGAVFFGWAPVGIRQS
jgi:hypothetical protein